MPSERMLAPVARAHGAAVSGHVSCACLLGGGVALLVCELSGGDGPPRLRLEARGHHWDALSPLALAQTHTGAVSWLAVLTDVPEETGLSGAVVLRTRRGEIELKPAEIRDVVVDPVRFARMELAHLDAELRERALEAALAATADAAIPRHRLDGVLRDLREALREPLPAAVVAATEPRAIAVEALWRLDDRAFYVEGWLRHEGAELTRIVAVSPEGERVELTDIAFRYPRPDVAEFYGDPDPMRRMGFIAYFETRAPSALEGDWVIELHDTLGAAETLAPPVHHDLLAARSTVLGDLALDDPDDELKVNHIRPAVSRIQRRLLGAVAVDVVDELGPWPREAETTIVVPLYRRIDLLEHQLAAFVHDPAICASDLLYVLDSPEQAEETRSFARQLYRLYGVPFRLAVLTRNGGYSAVNNLGAELGVGRRLLLLNSDVLPRSPGWLGALCRFYDETPGIGALSPKLLYEDGSIQFAGLTFEREAGERVWSNEHFFKGLAATLPAANVPRPVPSVTGACLLIDARLYEDLGGLSGDYVQGDYEDSDLCLRLALRDLQSWYLPAVELYHLEGQSYPSDERRLASAYNKWLHTHLWRDDLERLAADGAAHDLIRPRGE